MCLPLLSVRLLRLGAPLSSVVFPSIFPCMHAHVQVIIFSQLAQQCRHNGWRSLTVTSWWRIVTVCILHVVVFVWCSCFYCASSDRVFVWCSCFYCAHYNRVFVWWNCFYCACSIRVFVWCNCFYRAYYRVFVCFNCFYCVYYSLCLM